MPWWGFSNSHYRILGQFHAEVKLCGELPSRLKKDELWLFHEHRTNLIWYESVRTYRQMTFSVLLSLPQPKFPMSKRPQ